METICYLGQQEKQRTRKLYEISFPEDSMEFVDYYYKWKTKENEILVMGDQKLQVMIHLNPYELWINGHVRKIPYLVAVATDPVYRRQGRMGQVMKQALQDLAKKKVPFTFLLPADPLYYKGQGFVFFPNQSSKGRQEEPEQNLLRAAEADLWIHKADQKDLSWKQAQPEDFERMAEAANQWLGKRYQIFVKRDVSYYQRLMAETKAEHGTVLLLESEENIYGILVYGREEAEERGKRPIAEVKELLLETELETKLETEQKSALCEKALPDHEISFNEPRMMARIADLSSFVSVLKSEGKRVFWVNVRDDLIPANSGSYRIKIDQNGGQIERIPKEEAGGYQELTIAELTEMLLEDTAVFLNEWV